MNTTLNKMPLHLVRLNKALGAVPRASSRTLYQRYKLGDKKAIKALISIAIICGASSCGFHATMCQGGGCKAPADLATGIIAETRAIKGEKSAYWQNREIESNQKTWIENIFKRGN